LLGPAGVRLDHLPRDALQVRGEEPLRLEQVRPAIMHTVYLHTEQVRPAHMHTVYLHTELMRPRAHAAVCRLRRLTAQGGGAG
jgi:hypothetical protein